MPDITIQGTVIQFPNTSASPNWAPAIIQFAQAVEGALSGIVGSFDVAPQAMNIDAYNPGTDIQINSLNFPTSDVRAAFIRYSVFRTTDTNTAYEAGELLICYSPSNPVNNKWDVAQRRLGDGLITFNVSDTGQFSFTTTTLAGSSHTGLITFSANSILQS